MKVDMAKYVASYGICQKVKAEHQRPAELLNSLEIPEWNGTILQWTLWLDCLAHLEVKMLFWVVTFLAYQSGPLHSNEDD
jgi:hypothetical protein